MKLEDNIELFNQMHWDCKFYADRNVVDLICIEQHGCVFDITELFSVNE